MTRDRSLEAAAIFAGHGVADGLTTVLAALVVGTGGEANPVMRSLLEAGAGWAMGSMLLVTGLAAAVWPTAAEAVETPRWVGFAIAGVGIVVALGNLAVVASAGWSV